MHQEFPSGNAPAASTLTSRKCRQPLWPIREFSSRTGTSQNTPRKGCVLDEIDLQPAGYGGTALRYRHGRAWFETDRAPETDIL
jgi:hypothetical protein